MSKIKAKKEKHLGICANNRITRIKKKILKEVRRQKNDLTYRVAKIRIKPKFFLEIMQARREQHEIKVLRDTSTKLQYCTWQNYSSKLKDKDFFRQRKIEAIFRGAGGSGQSRLPTPLLHGLASTSRGHAEPHLPTVPCGGRMFNLKDLGVNCEQLLQTYKEITILKTLICSREQTTNRDLQ